MQFGRRSIGGVACVAALLSAGAARADGQTDANAEPPHFHLVYEAPPGCPDRPAFLAAIHAQTPRPQLASEGESAVSFTVTIDVGQSRASGRLDMREPDGARESRSVSSRTCGEVVKALALVAALILDPGAQTGPESPPPPQEPPPAATPPRGSVNPPATPAAARPAASASAPPSRRRPWTLSAGVELGVLGGIGPAVAPMGGAFIDGELAPRATRPVTSLLFTPALRISAYAAATSSDLGAGSQRYQWYGGSLRLCPLHIPLPARLRIAPCGALQLGVHRASTEDVPAPTQSLGLRIAPVVGGSLEWAASSSIAFELQGGVLFPLRRSRFFLAPNTTIFEIPVATGTATLALRLRFF